MILRGRLVLPICGPPIQDGAIVFSGRWIKAVGRWRDLGRSAGGKRLDLGEVVLMPGLVNAHCHLDYTNMAGQFPPPKAFIDWLKVITSEKADWSFSDYSQSWRSGARMLVETGTTTVGDIEAIPELLPQAWEWTPLRVISFLEMIGITKRRPAQLILSEALQKIASLRHPRCLAALSPHAPYSTLPELLQQSARLARRRRLLVCSHVAESALEFSMFKDAKGEMFNWLQRSGRDMSDCGNRSPIQHLEKCGALDRRFIAAHVNYLARGDAARLSQSGVSVVHCPRSHYYFNHGPFPLRRLRREAVNVCLGTDSLASVYKTRRQRIELNLFEEMRALAESESWLSARSIVSMATVNGARALGLGGRIGKLKAGALADVIALPLAEKVCNIYETVLRFQGKPSASLIDGRWAISPQ